MLCCSGDAHLVWKSGKASPRRAIFKMFKPKAEEKREAVGGERAFQRERDQCVQRP